MRDEKKGKEDDDGMTSLRCLSTSYLRYHARINGTVRRRDEEMKALGRFCMQMWLDSVAAILKILSLKLKDDWQQVVTMI